MKLFQKLLRENGHSVTAARLSLFKKLRAKHTLGMNDLIKQLPKQDQASIYRNIKLFEELGIAHKVQLGWKSRLELSDLFQHHHHHMICNNCDKVLELHNNYPVELGIAQVANQQGFTPLSHQLEVRGLCAACS